MQKKKLAESEVSVHKIVTRDRGGGESNGKCDKCVTRGEGGVKNGPNLCYVFFERSLITGDRHSAL